jgi:ATP-dependent helicase/nuclease subunit B
LSGGEKLLLNGKIDRVDIMDKDNTKYVKIIDYKSGQKAFQFSDIFYGLQPAL